MRAHLFAMVLAVGLGASVAVAPGCGDREKLDPIAQPSASTVDAGPPDAPPTDASVTPVREVLARNPLGGPPNNLLVDGDFEMSIVPAGAVGGQYGWNAFTAAGGQVAFFGETGGNCRTGIRCARASKDQLLFGRGTAAPNKAKVDATIWLKPIGTNVDPDPTKACKKLASITLVTCDTFDTRGNVGSIAAQGSDGWCEFHGTAVGSEESICLVVDLQADALADSAIMLPVVPAQTTATEPYEAKTDEVDAAEREKLKALGAIIRGRMRFDTGHGPDSVDALERAQPRL